MTATIAAFHLTIQQCRSIEKIKEKKILLRKNQKNQLIDLTDHTAPSKSSDATDQNILT